MACFGKPGDVKHGLILLTDADGIRRWRRTSMRNAWQVLLQGGRRQFVRPLPPLRAAWRGLRDGRRIARTALSGSRTPDRR